MRAFVITGPREGSVQEVAAPEPGPGQVVIAVDRVGVCGTDAEFFRGTQPYLATGGAKHPLRIGHEWCGRVARVGEGVDPAWVGRRVTGDTMLGCQNCELCRTGRQHVCEQRSEVGVLNGWHGALADELLMPVTAIHELPDSMSDALGALVEPASLSLRCVETLRLKPGDSLLVWGAGAVGLLAVAFAAAAGISVHVVGRSAGSLDLALQLGAEAAFRSEADGRITHYVPPAARAAGPAGNSVPRQGEWSAARYRGAIAASPDAAAPRHCLDRLEPGGHLVLVGISGDPSPLEARDLIVQDVTVSALLSGSPVFARTIEVLASGAVEAEALVGEVIGLEDVASALAGTLERSGANPEANPGAGPGLGPKVHIDLHRH